MDQEKIVMVSFAQNVYVDYNYPVVEFFTKRFWNLLILNRFLFEKALPEEYDFNFCNDEYAMYTSYVFDLYIKHHEILDVEEFKRRQEILFKIKPSFKKLISELLRELRSAYNYAQEISDGSILEYKENIERLLEEYDKNIVQQEEIMEENNGN